MVNQVVKDMTKKNLTFAKTWNGQQSTSPPYHVSLSISPQSGDVQIRVDAPFHNDLAPSAPTGKFEGLHNFEVVEIFVSGYPSAYHEECPYLEIQVGPHGHYFLAFFLQEQDWDNVDNSIDFENKPKIEIDRLNMRWTTELSIPSFLLPEPMCGEDLSVCWRVNATAIHGREPTREYLSYCPLPGDRPNFHQLEYFQEIQLFETLEVRENVDRTISIVSEMLKAKTPPKPGHVDTVFDLTAQLKQAVLDEEQVVVREDSGSAKIDGVSVDQIARQIRDRLLTSNIPSNLLELEEKFQRQIQSNEFVILHDTLWKRKSLSFRRRKLILTSAPRLFYLDTRGEYKGQVPWTMTKRITINKVSSVIVLPQ